MTDEERIRLRLEIEAKQLDVAMVAMEALGLSVKKSAENIDYLRGEAERLKPPIADVSVFTGKAADAADKLAISVRKAADTYEVLSTVVNRSVGAAGSYEIATDKVNHALDEEVRRALEATQAQKAMNMVMTEFGSVATAAAGSGGRGGGGRGVLGLSYAIQDFTTVLSMGGGLDRALFSISNNIDQMAMAAGASVANAAKMSIAFTGFAAALPIVTPLFKALWEAMAGGEGKGPEPVVKALDAAEERLKRIRSELEKILKATTTEEATTAAGFHALFAGYGDEKATGGQKITGGLAHALAASGRGPTAEQVGTDFERRAAGRTDADIERLVAVSQVPTEGQVVENPGVVRRRLQAERQMMRDVIQGKINTANVEAAGKLVGAAPTEKGARDTLRALAGQFPGAFPKGFAGHLGEMEPEAVAKGEAEDAEAESQEGRIHERLQERTKGRAEARRKKEAERREAEQVAEQRRRQEAAEKLKQEKLNAQVKELEEQFAGTGDEFDAKARNPSAAAQRNARKAGLESQAGQLMAHGPEIVGQAFGPQAAMAAANANPAEVQAMKAQTISNLEAGQQPMEAVANAFREVAEAVERNARRNQGFNAQINGIAQQTKRSLEQSAMPSGLQR